MKNLFPRLIGLYCVLVFSSCAIFTLPTRTTPTPPINPTDSETKTTTGGGTKTPTDSTTTTGGGTKTPTDASSTSTSPTSSAKFSDPDKLKVVFKKSPINAYLNEFSGVVRAVAKTTPSNKTTRNYESVGDVLRNLPTDSYMKQSGIGDASPRSVDEDFNVFVKKAYIFYISKEEDGDFHIIIGDLVNGEKKNLMTAEVSGLPKDKTTKAYFLLERTRRQLYEQFPDFFTGRKKTFTPKDNFPEIAIRGSLFFDTRHSAGQIGTGSSKPETVWEIHPITYFKFN